MTTLSLPLAFAAAGIALRGAGFAFRKFSSSLRSARLFGAIFAVSSVATPFFLGAVAGAIASGRVPAAGYGDRWTSWTGPSSMLGGTLAVTTCAFLAGTFLLADASRAGSAAIVAQLHRRVLMVGVLTGAIALGGALPLRADAPTLFAHLSGRGLPLVAGSALAGTFTVWSIARRRYRVARVGAVLAVAAVLAGWGTGQYPWLLADTLRLDAAAGAHATLVALLVVGAIALVIVVPSLAWLYRLVDTETHTELPAAKG